MSTTNITTAGKKGDIRVAFGFERYMVDGDYEVGPVLYLYTLMNRNVVTYIPCRQLGQFDERDRDPRTKDPICLPRCAEIAERLYGMPTSYGASRVLAAISEWMTDAKNMPPPSTCRDLGQAVDMMRRHGFDVVE